MSERTSSSHPVGPNCIDGDMKAPDERGRMTANPTYETVPWQALKPGDEFRLHWSYDNEAVIAVEGNRVITNRGAMTMPARCVVWKYLGLHEWDEDSEDDVCPTCGFDTESNVLVRTKDSADVPCGACLWAHEETR